MNKQEREKLDDIVQNLEYAHSDHLTTDGKDQIVLAVLHDLTALRDQATLQS